MRTIDDRTCPHCGHQVLSWEFACPGCGMVPAETPEGRKELRRIDLIRVMREEWPTVVGFFFLAVLLALWFIPGRRSPEAPAAPVSVAAPALPADDRMVAVRSLDSSGLSVRLFASGKVVVAGLLPSSAGGGDLTFPDLDSVAPTIEAMRHSPHAPPAVSHGAGVDWLLREAVPSLRTEAKKAVH